MHGYGMLRMAVYGYAWVCRVIHGCDYGNVELCRAMYSFVWLCDQVHSSLVDILFYFFIIYNCEGVESLFPF